MAGIQDSPKLSLKKIRINMAGKCACLSRFPSDALVCHFRKSVNPIFQGLTSFWIAAFA